MKGNFFSWAHRLMACVVCGVMAVSMVWAERVSEADAALVADHFMNVTSSSAHGQKAPAKRMVLKKAAVVEENQFYIYENADGEGWVMVAANDVVRPILAYSETGHFRTDNMPDNISRWMGKYNKFIKQLEKEGATAGEETKKAWRSLRMSPRKAKGDAVVGPLVKTQWDQGAPYDLYTPGSGTWGSSSNKSAVGCVATAMAQVMKYWEWPVTGTGSHTYQPIMQTKSGNIILYEGELTANFGETTYQWSQMKNKHYTSDSQAQKQAVATLMYHCGIGVDMMYGSYQYGGSGAYTIDYDGYWSGRGVMCAETALKTFFGYKSTLKGYVRDGNSNPYLKSWTENEWVAMLKTELDASRPIMYAGAGDEGGHSFICDGYDDAGYFHFNWGWSGSNDGYYTLSNLAPGSGGAGGGGYDFSEDQDVIVGIEPDREAVSVTGVTVAPTELTLKIKERAELTATVLPDDASIKAVTWSSDNTAVAKVSTAGVVTGIAAGTANITVTTTDGNKTATCAVTVTNEVMPAIELVVDYGWAEYVTSDNYWILITADNNAGIPWLQFYFDSGSTNKIAGTYDLANAGVYLWNDPNDESAYVKSTSGQLNVTCTGKDNGAQGCNTYHITASFICDDDLEYTLNTTLEICGQDDGSPATAIDLADEVGDGEPVILTWIADGVEFATTTCAGSVVLPEGQPTPCTGKVFVGWCADANYESETTAPTFVQNGDAVSEAKTFYAVFATPGTGGSSSFDGTSAGNYKIYAQVGSTKYYAVGTGAKISSTTNEAEASVYTFEKLTNGFAIKLDDSYIKYDSSTDLGTQSNSYQWNIVSGVKGTWRIKSNATSTRAIIFRAGSTNKFGGYATSNVTAGGTEYYDVEIEGGGTSYSDYTTICTAPCVGDLTSITLNTDNVKKVFTEGEAFTYEGLVVTANYDGCESKTVTPTSVSTPDMNQIGAQDVTVTYEDKSATYQITVNALPTYAIRFFDNTTLLSSQNVKQGQAATPPTSDPTACEEYTFVGWYTTTLAEDNTVEPTCVTNFTATKNQDYYAVFSKTEEGEGGSSKNVTFTASDLYSNEEAAGTKELEGVTFAYAIGSNTQNAPKYYSNGTSVRMYGGNTLTISAASAISAIQFTYGSTTAGFTANVGTLNDDAWTGNAESIVFTASGKHWIQVIVVTVGSGASSTTYYTTAPTCEECTAAVTITKGTPANGSFTLDKVGEQSTCDGQLVVTVSDIVPVSGYRFQAITQTGIEGAVIDQDNKTVTYAKKANGESTINVVFEAIPTYIISFYDNGTKISEQEVLEGESAEKPEDPEPACEAYTFEGWYTAELAANNTVKPTYVTDFTATKDQDYYAIFKKEETIGTAEQNYPYTFTSKSWADATNSWTSDKDGNQLTSGQGVQVTAGASGAGATIKSSVENVSKVVVNYCTNASKGAGSITVTVGENESTKSVTSTGGTSLRDLEFAFENKSGVVTFEVACTTNSIYVNAITITAGGSTTTTFYTSSVTASNCKWPTEVENIDDEKPAAVKALMNGQIVIIRGEAVYSITGVRLQ